MKHIKTYKLFESDSSFDADILADINDMLLDISDVGGIYINPPELIRNQIFIEICGGPDTIGKTFKIDQNTASVVERIFRYIKVETDLNISIVLRNIDNNTYEEIWFKNDSQWVSVENNKPIDIIEKELDYISIVIRKKDFIYESLEQEKIYANEIKQYLTDIFQELIDNNFYVGQNGSSNLHDGRNTIEYIRVDISKRGGMSFEYSEIKDYVDSSIDYMKSIGFKVLKTASSGVQSFKRLNNNKTERTRGKVHLNYLSKSNESIHYLGIFFNKIKIKK